LALVADPSAKHQIILDVLRWHARKPFAFDELRQCGVVSVPSLCIRLRPLPARNVFKAGYVISLPLDSPHKKVLPLTGDPRIEAHIILDVSRWNLDVSFALLERHKRTMAALPLVGPTLPCPPRQSNQPVDLLLGKSSTAVDTLIYIALLLNPPAERFTLLQMRTRHQRGSFARHKPLQQSDHVLPSRVVMIPRPARERLQTLYAFIPQLASTVQAALVATPLTQTEPVNHSAMCHRCRSVTLDVTLKQLEPEVEGTRVTM
jgi:hypothetical protein